MTGMIDENADSEFFKVDQQTIYLPSSLVLPRESLHVDVYKISIKTCRFYKIISDINPFFLFIIRIPEQYSDATRCGILIKDLLPSKTNW